MSSKKILIICPGTLFPTIMANQVRIKLLTEELNKKHFVDLITLEDDKDFFINNIQYTKICRHHYPIIIPNHKHNIIGRAFYSIGRRLTSLFWGIPSKYYYPSLPQIQKKINEIINKNDYDLIQFEYWFMGKFIKKLKYRPFLAIDTHCIYHQDTERELRVKYQEYEKNNYAQREVEAEKNLESFYIRKCDLIISISQSDHLYYKNKNSNTKVLFVPTGMNLNDFLNSSAAKNNKPTVLFYGSLGSFQNTNAFFELWNKIFPVIKKEIPEVQLKVVGANPPDSIKKLSNLDYVEVTGFVKDLPESLSSCHLKILPMKVGGGFRSRLVEVMACGVPVIGTHIGVDSLGYENGVHGYISDDYSVLANRAVELLKDDIKREQMGVECKKFVADRYTIEKTYGRLSEYYFDLEL